MSDILTDLFIRNLKPAEKEYTRRKMRTKVVSGGQTFVDQVRLDAALEAGLTLGSWCPKGRLAERVRTKRTAANSNQFSDYE